jgi:hypothetical protein
VVESAEDPLPYGMVPACMAAQPVPPDAAFNIPERVMVPEFVMGPPDDERPVEPPDMATDVTVPPPIQEPLTAKHPPYGRLIPAMVDVAVVEAAIAEMKEEKVEVPRLPTIVVVAVPPTKIPLSEERAVVDAPRENCCSAVQVLADPVFRVTAPFE